MRVRGRRAQRVQAALEAATALTFKDCTEQHLAAHSAGWRNAKHAAQRSSTLKTYAEPVIGALSVHSIDTALVMKIIEPLWSKKPETASRLRGRIEAVLDWATVRSFRQGENPARWRGHLDKLLPARTGEVIGAQSEEVNDKVWTVPAGRMKASKEHRVPLSAAALAVIETLRKVQGGAHLFPGGKRDKPLSNMAMLALLDRMGRSDLTMIRLMTARNQKRLRRRPI
jgi:integrase